MTKTSKKRATAGTGCLRRRTRIDGMGRRVLYGNYMVRTLDAHGKMTTINLGTSAKNEAMAKYAAWLAN